METTTNASENTAKQMQDAAQEAQTDAAANPEQPEEEKARSEFSAEVNAVAYRLTDMVRKYKRNRAFILVSVDSTPEDGNDSGNETIIACVGRYPNLLCCLKKYIETENNSLLVTAAMLMIKAEKESEAKGKAGGKSKSDTKTAVS